MLRTDVKVENSMDVDWIVLLVSYLRFQFAYLCRNDM